jgi:hypothetical protein
MAVFENVEDAYTLPLASYLSRALGSFALTGVVIGPLLVGAFLGYVVTERLDDPEGMAIEANLPLVKAEILPRTN